MKKLLCMLITICLAAMLFGCSDNNKNESSTPSEDNVKTQSSPIPTPAKKEVSLVKALDDGVNIRTEANTDCEVLSQTTKGDYFRFTEKKDDWYEIVYKGDVAYISTDYSTLVEMTDAEANQLLKLKGNDEDIATSEPDSTAEPSATADSSKSSRPISADNIRGEEDPEAR